MNIGNLNRRLDSAMNTYCDEVQALFDARHLHEPATKEDLFELSKRVAYILGEFQKALVSELK